MAGVPKLAWFRTQGPWCLTIVPCESGGFGLCADDAHNRPNSARFPARVEGVFGGAPITLLSHSGGPKARATADTAPIALNKPSLAEVGQFRTKKEYCSASLHAIPSLT